MKRRLSEICGENNECHVNKLTTEEKTELMTEHGYLVLRSSDDGFMVAVIWVADQMDQYAETKFCKTEAKRRLYLGIVQRGKLKGISSVTIKQSTPFQWNHQGNFFR